MNIKEIIAKMGFGEQAEVTVFKHEEDDSDYAVWKIEEDGVARVLKKTSRQEPDVYNAFLASAECGAPRFYKSIEHDGELFFLMEYIKGHNLQKCDRESLTAALDALIYLQNMYWEKRELQGMVTVLRRVCREGKSAGNISMTRNWSKPMNSICEFIQIFRGRCVTTIFFRLTFCAQRNARS